MVNETKHSHTSTEISNLKKESTKPCVTDDSVIWYKILLMLWLVTKPDLVSRIDGGSWYATKILTFGWQTTL